MGVRLRSDGSAARWAGNAAAGSTKPSAGTTGARPFSPADWDSGFEQLSWNAAELRSGRIAAPTGWFSAKSFRFDPAGATSPGARLAHHTSDRAERGAE